ncbi:MAG: hypothetical protein BWX88_05095 [Planctomycetes bacterium ADurb.Bin126]|nr:MAG: hypothetical protein BWX88_05095 [Planctomycetes bacterium ADurb.Bin126]HOD84736.1 DUF4326 domain-containing protein [Phycisphaerae bacterium]
MTTPRRIQLSRRKGWRLPADTVVVARPSRWGNPFRVGPDMPRVSAVAAFRFHLSDRPGLIPYTKADVREHLRGKDLACWCPLDQPCHADVLLEIANEVDP